MALVETPALLLYGSDQEYIDRLRAEYHDKKVRLPEGKDVLFFFPNIDDCMHTLCGKGSTKVNRMRAQRILWIKFILEHGPCRQVKLNIKTGNIIFVCQELAHLVICRPLSGGDLKYVSSHPFTKQEYVQRYGDPKIYPDHILI